MKNNYTSFRKYFSFIGALILTNVIYFIVMCIVVFSFFTLSGENLEEKEFRDAFCFYACIFAIVYSGFIAFKRYKSNRRFSAAGITISILFPLYLSYLTASTYFKNVFSYEEFNSKRWKELKIKPYDMARTVVKRDGLKSKSKEEVIEMLGWSNDNLDNCHVDYVYYWTDYPGWHLRVYFIDAIVSEAYLYEAGLDL